MDFRALIYIIVVVIFCLIQDKIKSYKLTVAALYSFACYYAISNTIGKVNTLEVAIIVVVTLLACDLYKART